MTGSDSLPIRSDSVTQDALVLSGIGDGAACYAHRDRHRLSMVGKGAAAALNGLVTNDVQSLRPGHGVYAAALTPKGKILADMTIHMVAEDAFLVSTAARAGDGWMEVVRKYVNPRLARYENVSESLAELAVLGPGAAAVLSMATGAQLELLLALGAYESITLTSTAGNTHIVRNDGFPVPGYLVFTPAQEEAALHQKLISSGAPPLTEENWNTLRIVTCTPEWGIEMDDTTLAQEANLEERNAISFTKGCYTGQEVVARIKYRGHVNQHLQTITLPPSEKAKAGAKLLTAEGKEIGQIRSVATTPTGTFAITMLRRTGDDWLLRIGY